MSDIAIKCEGLSKQYRLGERGSYKALRDVITDAATSPFRRLRAAVDGRRATGDGASHDRLPQTGDGESDNGRPSPVLGQSSGPRSPVPGLMKQAWQQ